MSGISAEVKPEDQKYIQYLKDQNLNMSKLVRSLVIGEAKRLMAEDPKYRLI
jgi:hypothetical protein